MNQYITKDKTINLLNNLSTMNMFSVLSETSVFPVHFLYFGITRN